jgi:amidase
VFVRGAEPGDSLVVAIQEIRLGPVGYNRILPGRGVSVEGLHAPRANIVTVRNGIFYFDERIQFPARPTIGVIGTAPAGEPC